MAAAVSWMNFGRVIWTAGEGFGYLQLTEVIDLFVVLGQRVAAW